MSKESRGAKGEDLVIEELSKIQLYHHLLNNVTLVNPKSGMSHQIDHILIHPHGVFVIETKNYYGEIIYDEEGRWFKSLRGQRIRIASPLSQNKSHEIALYRALKGQIKPIPVVVYVKNNAPYLPDDNVIDLKDLLFFIECAPYDHEFSPLTMDKIKAAIERESVDVSLSEHVENIRVMKEVRKEKEAEMAYAIEKRICPWCGGKIIVEGDLFRCSNCRFRFKLR